MAKIKNAAPQVYNLGANDLSKRSLKPERDPIPQHLPLFYIPAQKGTTARSLISVAKLPLLYGTETFNLNGKFANHQTKLMTKIAGTGNSVMVKRIVAADAGPRSSAIVYVDILETQVPNYLRDSMGNIVYDVNNTPRVNATTPTITGHKIKFIKEYHKTNNIELGLLTTKSGTMLNGATTSTMYPILEIVAAEQGEAYNNNGIVLSSVYKADVDNDVVQTTKSLVYRLSLVSREDKDATPTIFRSLYGEPFVNVSLKDRVINPSTTGRFDMKYIFDTMFFNEKDSLKDLKYNEYTGMHLYNGNIEFVSKKIITKEALVLKDEDKIWEDGEIGNALDWYDFTTDDVNVMKDQESYLLNLFTLRSSKNVSYLSAVISTDIPTLVAGQKEIAINSSSQIWLDGGSDGTTTVASYEAGVRADLAKYLDNDSDLMDTAINVESIMYDTGFELPTKEAMFNMIALRKDTVVVLSTRIDSLGDKVKSLSEQRAIGVALREAANLAPESEYHGTGVARALIVLGSGLLRDGSGKRMPLTYELGYKAARMMGAGDGNWDMTQMFDIDPNNRLTELTDIEPAFVPNGIKATLWNDGLVWPQPADREEFAFLQLQTVYTDDTSVLNNFFNVMALATISKVGESAWRKFSGSTALSEGEFIDTVRAYVNSQLKDRFGGMIMVIPDVYIDEYDALRGYSWHLTNKMYANNSKTVMTYTTEVYRASDLTSN